MPTSQSQDSSSECSNFFFNYKGFRGEQIYSGVELVIPLFRVITTVGTNIIYQMTLVCATGDGKF
jgi:hypothetical protein